MASKPLTATEAQRLRNEIMQAMIAAPPLHSHTTLLDPTHSHAVTPFGNYQYETQGAMVKAIAIRLRVPEGGHLGFDALFPHKSGEKVFLFVVQDGKAVTLEDEWGLFPSDQLITQLRMLKG